MEETPKAGRSNSRVTATMRVAAKNKIQSYMGQFCTLPLQMQNLEMSSLRR